MSLYIKVFSIKDKNMPALFKSFQLTWSRVLLRYIEVKYLNSYTAKTFLKILCEG